MANFSLASSVFNAVDTNQDGAIDRNEFQNFLGGGASASNSYESSYSSGGDFGGASFGGASFGGASYGGASYGEASFGGASSGEASFGGASYGAASFGGAAAGGYGSSVQVSQYAADAQGIYQDPNPQIIRRAAAEGAKTYTQNIRVQFLQPPPLPPPGPLIIREVRPPQPPAPAPLRVVQRAKPLPTPPPLVLRERPPVRPAVVQSQTVIRRLPGLPVPPRSVIIERVAPAPPKPRDIIIERWVPYGAQAKRQVLVQRAAAAKAYAAPRNVIIQYEPVGVRVVRQFQRLGVTQANPASYVQQYGASLLDANSLLAQARAAGVVEDISAGAFSSSSASAVGFGAASYGQEVVVGGGASGGSWGGASSWESAGAGAGAGFGGASSWESSSFSSGGGFGGAGDAFSAADTNQDGSLDQNEFSAFLNQNLA